MPDDDYLPEAIHVLAGMEPRPEGVTIGTGPEHWWASIDGLAPEPVAVWRDVGGCEDPTQPWGAERLGVEGVLWPDRVRLVARALPPGGRIALRAQDLTDDEMAAIMASTPDGSRYSLDDIPDAPSARYPVEDGPGSGTRVELAVRVLVGTDRSIVIVADPITRRALERELVHHGGEAGAAAVAVSAALRARLPGEPGGVAGGSREPPGEPRE